MIVNLAVARCLSCPAVEFIPCRRPMPGARPKFEGRLPSPRLHLALCSRSSTNLTEFHEFRPREKTLQPGPWQSTTCEVRLWLDTHPPSAASATSRKSEGISGQRRALRKSEADGVHGGLELTLNLAGDPPSEPSKHLRAARSAAAGSSNVGATC